MANHVNLFDPFMLYCAIPQLVRGWELESHFKMTQDAIDGGTSLIIFPEAMRTRSGHLSAFQDGGFRVAQQLGVPIVPVSLVGSFQHHRTGHWMLWPATITVYLHDTISTEGMKKHAVPELRDRVHKIISDPVEASLLSSNP